MTAFSFFPQSDPVRPVLVTWGVRGLPWGLALLVFALSFVLSGMWIDARLVHQADVAHADAQRDVAAVARQLRGALSENLMVGSGMVAFVAANPNLDELEFRTIAHNLLSHRTQVRNITLVKGTVVRQVYPLTGNEAVLGMDFQENRAQWPVVQRVLREKKVLVAGPLRLVQGGEAFVARFPIVSSGTGAVWGMVSVPIETEALFTRAGLFDERPYRIAMRGRDGMGEEGEVFFGDASVFQNAPEVASVLLPEGSWQVAAVPVDGWPNGLGDLVDETLQASGSVLMACLAFVGGVLLRQRASPLMLRRGMVLHLNDQKVWAVPVVRMAFLNAAEAEMAVCRRYARPLAVLTLRFPDYPVLVSRMGDDAAQKIVQKIGFACRNAIRPQDVLGMLSPGVLAIVLTSVNEDGLAMAADRVTRAIRSVCDFGSLDGNAVLLGAAIMTDGDSEILPILERALAVERSGGAGLTSETV